MFSKCIYFQLISDDFDYSATLGGEDSELAESAYQKSIASVHGK